jgi:hypothetical protein
MFLVQYAQALAEHLVTGCHWQAGAASLQRLAR